MLLILDNYDSFVFNLARYFRRLGQQTEVRRNDAIDAADIRSLKPAAIVLSPGPCTPREAGCSLEVVRQLHEEVPILGVCLGHQTVAAAFGGQIVRASEPMHGRTSLVRHRGTDVFAGLPDPLCVGRYHSLVADEATLPDCLEITARSDEGAIMGLAHRWSPTFGVQFHPESVLTEGGFALLANFLAIAGLPVPAVLPTIASERPAAAVAAFVPPSRPVTF